MTRPREGQTFGGSARFIRWINFVKLPHTVFALPFALVGATLASFTRSVPLATIGWIVLAFTAARFAAMGFNRIVDRTIDARNPRTARREIPSGLLGVREASLAVILASGVFIFASWMLNPLCAALSPIALGWVLWYSYTKRFTHWSHVVLGIGLAIAPVGGYLAVMGAWSSPWWMLIALAVGVSSWTAGFDILYALQDEEFDRAEHLFSIPVVFGRRGALTIARGLHVLTVMSLAAVGTAVPVGWLYAAGVCVAAGLLLYEHSLVRGDDLSKLDAAFFTMNGVISLTFFGFVLAERLVQ